MPIWNGVAASPRFARKAAARTALPQPLRTSQRVPRNSAVSFFWKWYHVGFVRELEVVAGERGEVAPAHAFVGT